MAHLSKFWSWNKIAWTGQIFYEIWYIMTWMIVDSSCKRIYVTFLRLCHSGTYVVTKKADMWIATCSSIVAQFNLSNYGDLVRYEKHALGYGVKQMWTIRGFAFLIHFHFIQKIAHESYNDANLLWCTVACWKSIREKVIITSFHRYFSVLSLFQYSKYSLFSTYHFSLYKCFQHFLGMVITFCKPIWIRNK